MFNTHFRTRQSHEPCGCKKVKLQLRCTVANLLVQYELQVFLIITVSEVRVLSANIRLFIFFTVTSPITYPGGRTV